MRCSNCGNENPAGARFCNQCGLTLASTSSPGHQTEFRPSLTGERRHLTVLFCDLVGSTEIAARLDPEDWREIVASYHRAAAEAITRFGGHVAKYLGDGVMAFFGYPEAHENNAELAARAALAMLEAITRLGKQPEHPQLSARVAIDSGAVVVGAGAGREADVFGETPNIAARVQAAAAPGTVVITAATHRLISGLFVVEPLGVRALKGITPPPQVFRLIRPTGVRGRLRAARGLTPFVGREEELRLLLSRWERTRQGEGQVTLIIGEPGIGKSRLVAEFHNRIRDTPHIWMESAGEQLFKNTPFHAVSEMLSRWLELQSGGGREEQFERLERALASAGLKVEEAAPLISELLQLPLDERYPQSKLTPEEKRRRLLAALAGWTFGAARLQPMVMVVEDLHWLDPSTLDSQQLLVEQGATVPLMLLYTARPEFRPPWPLRAHHTQIALNRLSARNVREMIAQVAVHKALAHETVDAVVERTSGVPLFVEELTRAVLESGSETPSREIPVTLHDSLMARLDRLGSAKEVIQIGAVIGSEFSYELLQAAHRVGGEELQSALRSATDAELVYVRGIAPESTYQFKHALIRDAAYEALLKSRRKELHRLMAQTIDEQFPTLKEAHPEILARHWTDAEEIEPAITEWSRAGRAAEGRNAFHEAQESYQQALAQLSRLPESPERDSRELDLRRTLVAILQLTRGWGASEGVEIASRFGVLAESVELGWLVRSITAAGHAYFAGDLSTAAALIDEALELALPEGNPIAMAWLHGMQVVVRFYRGDLVGADSHFSAGLNFFDHSDFRQNLVSPAMTVFGRASLNAWLLGRADVARERAGQISAVVNPANPHDRPWSDVVAAFVYAFMRQDEGAEKLERAVDLCDKYRFPGSAALSRIILGHARAELGRTADGVVLIRHGIDDLLRIGRRLGVPSYLTWLAAAQRADGGLADALETVELALNFNREEAVYGPETLRIRGELRLEQGDRQLAEADFRDSIVMARSMGAKAWELRTTMSLARLLDSGGRPAEARTTLAEIYNWFTEGFDTVDLKEAKALLDELSN